MAMSHQTREHHFRFALEQSRFATIASHWILGLKFKGGPRRTAKSSKVAILGVAVLLLFGTSACSSGQADDPAGATEGATPAGTASPVDDVAPVTATGGSAPVGSGLVLLVDIPGNTPGLAATIAHIGTNDRGCVTANTDVLLVAPKGSYVATNGQEIVLSGYGTHVLGDEVKLGGGLSTFTADDVPSAWKACIPEGAETVNLWVASPRT